MIRAAHPLFRQNQTDVTSSLTAGGNTKSEIPSSAASISSGNFDKSLPAMIATPQLIWLSQNVLPRSCGSGFQGPQLNLICNSEFALDSLLEIAKLNAGVTQI